MTALEQIIRDLRSKARQASRLPSSHKDKVHGEINGLLDAWELAVAVSADLDGLGAE